MSTLLGEGKLNQITDGLKETKNIEGVVFECGVYKGGSALYIANTLIELDSKKEFHIFDSFCGMPSATEYDNYHKKGDFNDTSLQSVATLLSGKGVVIHEGFIPDTFSEVSNVNKVSFVHIDLDLYEGYKYTLEFVYPKMDDGAVMILDDYGSSSCQGAVKAVNDFLSDKIELPKKVCGTQYKIIKGEEG